MLDFEDVTPRKKNTENTEETANIPVDEVKESEKEEEEKADTEDDEYEKTGARIIARDSGNWYHSFAIDNLAITC